MAFSSPQKNEAKEEVLGMIRIGYVKKFIDAHYEGALMVKREYGVPVALSLSMWSLESGYGRDPLAKAANNYGGLMTRKKSHIKFKSVESFYHCYGRTLTKPCYKNVQPQTMEEWMEALKYNCCAYHGTPNYDKKLWWIINTFCLDELEV